MLEFVLQRLRYFRPSPQPLDGAPQRSECGQTSRLSIQHLLIRLSGAGDFQLRENTNSSELGGSALAPVTSYIYGYYR